MADPLKEPLDLEDVFAPYSPTAKTKTTEPQEDTTFGKIVSNLYQEGKLGKPAAVVGAGVASYGIKKAWNKSVDTSFNMVKEALKKEQEALSTARNAGLTARPVTLNRPLVGVMQGATVEGAGLPTTEAAQRALARRVTGSRWGRPFGLGNYADRVLTPQIEITPRMIVQADAEGGNALGLTNLRERILPPRVVPASGVSAAVENGGVLTTVPKVGAPAVAEVPAFSNAYQTGGRALYNMHMGNAGIPLNSLSNVGSSLFKSGVGLGALMEGTTAAYDTWPTFLGGSGDNIYGRTRDELRRGIDPSNTFNYDIMPAIGGGLATIGRIGKGAANALTLGAYGLAESAVDMHKSLKEAERKNELAFVKEPELYHPDNLERTRQRLLATGMIHPDSPQAAIPENTPEAIKAYEAKLNKLKKDNPEAYAKYEQRVKEKSKTKK